MFRLTICLLFFLGSQGAWGRALNKVYEFNFKPQQTIYMHSGSKSTLRLNNIPSDIDLLQVSLARRKDSPRAHLIGNRNIDIKKSASLGWLDINIEIEELSELKQARYPIELKFKSLKEINGQYIVLEHFSNFIRMIVCPSIEQAVCGLASKPCRSKLNCREGEQVEQTFLNLCEMEKAGASLIHYASCNIVELKK
jgi:hypothetical protein